MDRLEDAQRAVRAICSEAGVPAGEKLRQLKLLAYLVNVRIQEIEDLVAIVYGRD